MPSGWPWTKCVPRGFAGAVEGSQAIAMRAIRDEVAAITRRVRRCRSAERCLRKRAADGAFEQ